MKLTMEDEKYQYFFDSSMEKPNKFRLDKAANQFDYQGAKEWYKKAAKLKDKQAQKNLKILNKLS